MRRFRFTYEKLEAVRGTELDLARQETAGAEQGLRRAQEKLASTRDTLEQTYEELARLRRLQADPLFLLSMEGYAGLLREGVRTGSVEVLQQSQALDEARLRLTQKHREKKLLEKVRERQHGEYSLYAQREDQKELDETAKHAHTRNAKTGRLD